MTTEQASHLNVFISYSHDSLAHADRVLALADRLRADGIDCVLDQYEVSPPEGWPRWMERHLREADFVLMICTPTYARRVRGEEEAGTGLGVRWEGHLLDQYFYQAGTLNTRFIPVLLEGGDIADIPTPYQGSTYYRPTTEAGYRALYRRLTNQPATPRPALGKLQRMPPRTRTHAFLEQMREEHDHALLWHVPLRRNPFFTGRDGVLQHLHEALARQRTAVLAQVQAQAISGLGGIGKTQTALEYAYRYRDEYRAVLWAKADSREALSADFLSIAGVLQLPEKDAQDQSLAVHAVKQWFEASTHWLLILDNADDLPIVQDFLPTSGHGHILLTTRARPVGMIAERLELETMESEEGALLLLRRAGILRSDALMSAASAADRAQALQLVAELGGLPLAIDQAGAYIEETGSDLSRYLHLYQTRRKELLKRRSSLPTDHPEPVATTWSLSFQKGDQANPAAADLLRFCAFLHPDAIPEVLIIAGAPDLGAVLEPVARDPLLLDEAIGEISRFSLVRRHPGTHTMSVHRLVQAVLKDEMDEHTQQAWAARTVRAVSRGFPYAPEVATWPTCQRYLPHALECAALIQQGHLAFAEAARLLQQAGSYLRHRAQYVEAEPLLQGALALYEQVLGPEHRLTADSLVYLSILYWNQGKYEQAEPLYQRALAIREQVLGPEHPNTASTLNNLASLYDDQGKYEQAEPLYRRALAIYEQALGPDHPRTVKVRENYTRLREKMKQKAE